MKKLIALGAVLIASLALVAPQAHAAISGGQLTFFNTTNVISGTGGTSNLTSWPTNGIGTNGIGISTGNAVAVGQFDYAQLVVQGYLNAVTFAAGTNGIIGITLTTASGNTQPTVVLGTNVFSAGLTNIIYNDWCPTNQMIQVNFTVPPSGCSNYITLQTNISAPSLLQAANWVGIYAITNGLGTGAVLTNAQIGLNTKLLPKPLN
jgi:hypothetical protein